VLSLHGGVGVQPVREHHKGHVGGDVAQGLILLDGAGESQEHQGDPGPAALGDHLDVHLANARVQDGAHEEVVDHIARAGGLAVVLVGHGQAVEVPAHGGHVGDDHGGEETLAEVVGHEGQREDAQVVHQEQTGHAEVVAGVAVAVVVEALAVGCGGQTLHGESGHEAGQHQLHEEEKEVRHPDGLGRDTLGHDQLAHRGDVALEGVHRSRNDDVATIRLQAVPMMQ